MICMVLPVSGHYCCLIFNIFDAFAIVSVTVAKENLEYNLDSKL